LGEAIGPARGGVLFALKEAPAGLPYPIVGSGDVRPLKASPSGGLRPALTGLVDCRLIWPVTVLL